MNAETPKATELNLPQAFLLLATNDKDGKPEVPVFALRTTLAGAILAELELIGAIELQGKNVRATRAAPPTDFQHELELIRGEIFANVWQTDEVVRIDPATGHVRGVIDFAGLLPAAERTPDTDVLNGIAYDAERDRLFVTGKRWPKIFEVRLKVR